MSSKEVVQMTIEYSERIFNHTLDHAEKMMVNLIINMIEVYLVIQIHGFTLS